MNILISSEFCEFASESIIKEEDIRYMKSIILSLSTQMKKINKKRIVSFSKKTVKYQLVCSHSTLRNAYKEYSHIIKE